MNENSNINPGIHTGQISSDDSDQIYSGLNQQAELSSMPIEDKPKQKMSFVRLITRFLVKIGIVRLFQTRPLFATVLLLGVGAGLSSGASYLFSSDTAQIDVEPPIVQASSKPFKRIPSDDQMMAEKSAKDSSTIYNIMRSDTGDQAAAVKKSDKTIHNLMDGQTVVDASDNKKRRAIDEKLAQLDKKAEALLADNSSNDAGSEKIVNILKTKPKARVSAQRQTPSEVTKTVAAILKSKNPLSTATAMSAPKPATKPAFKAQVRTAVKDARPPQAGLKKPETLHAAGSSPDTLAFVRSVLDNKDNNAKRNLNTLEPAGGETQRVPVAKTGQYYVQLGSVTSLASAKGAWDRYAKRYSLNTDNFRIEEANLGERGTFYRIQAGPYEERAANGICNSIKAQKPGGCLVIRR